MTTPNNGGAAFPREEVFVDERGLTIRAPRKPVSPAAGGGVDVLDAMSLSSQEIRKAVHDDLADYLGEARAAVAELIAAARDLRCTKPTYSIAYGQAEQRLDAALSNIEGGK